MQPMPRNTKTVVAKASRSNDDDAGWLCNTAAVDVESLASERIAGNICYSEAGRYQARQAE